MRRWMAFASFASLVLAATGCKPALESAEPAVRLAAVAQLTDQRALAKTALADPDSEVRLAAIKRLTKVRLAAVWRLTDQRALTEMALKETVDLVGSGAVQKLTDPETDTALTDSDGSVGSEAVKKLTDPALLTKVALEARCARVRTQAVTQISDQAVLAKVALEDDSSGVRWNALWLLTDQTALAQVALFDKDRYLSKQAFSKLTDAKLKARFGDHYLDRLKAISAVSESEPRLRRTADVRGSDCDRTVDWKALARMKVATQEPRIRSHLPRLRCIGREGKVSETYRSTTDGSLHQAYGDGYTFTLLQDGNTIAVASWQPYFPANAGDAGLFPDAAVLGEDLLRQLLRRSVFTANDLTDLFLHSELEEVRIAAIDNITDQAALERLALEAGDVWGRETAISRMTDEARLAELARGKPPTSKAADKRLQELISKSKER